MELKNLKTISQICSSQGARLMLVNKRLQKNISDNIILLLLIICPQKLRLRKILIAKILIKYFNNYFLCKPFFPQLQRIWSSH